MPQVRADRAQVRANGGTNMETEEGKDMEELTPEERKHVLQGEWGNVELWEVWTDDHITCISMKLNLPSGEVIVKWWWCGEDGYAAARYANACPQAKADLLKGLRDQMLD